MLNFLKFANSKLIVFFVTSSRSFNTCADLSNYRHHRDTEQYQPAKKSPCATFLESQPLWLQVPGSHWAVLCPRNFPFTEYHINGVTQQ